MAGISQFIFLGRHWLPYRLSSQLLAFVGITAAISALIVGSVFTFDSVEHGRDQVNQEIIFLGKNIAAMSGMLILTNDRPFLEDVLTLNAQFPMVESILVTDDKGKVLGEVIKQHGKIIVNPGSRILTPHDYDKSLTATTGHIAHPSLVAHFLPEDNLLEMWHPVIAGYQLGSVRVQYSLAELRATILKQWWRTLLYASLSVLGVLSLLALLLRAPMRALHETTTFASALGDKMGAQIPIYEATKEFSELTQALNGLSLQLHAQDKALTDRISQNQSILDNIVDGIVTFDTVGTIHSFNRAACQIFGYQPHEVIGRKVHVLMAATLASNAADADADADASVPIPPDDKTGFEAAIYTGFDAALGIGREAEALRKDGSQFPIDLAISRSTEHDEVIFIGIIRDITERRRLDRLKSEFVSTVSHELRTPLTSIHGSLKLLEGGVAGALAPAAQQLIHIAQKSSQRLILLINDLLDMEKLTAGKMVFDLVPVNLVDAVKQSLQDNFGYGTTHHVRYVLQASDQVADQGAGQELPPILEVIADPARLAQVLANLLSNAAKFSAGAPQVDVRISRQDAWAKVEVEDHGDGIPLDFQAEIFGAFAQANNGNTRKQGGTGLGLKISKGMVQAMNGQIGFDTNIGEGTVFWFTLPLRT